MARRPARLERAGALTPRDRMWAAIRRFGPIADMPRAFSVVEIAYLSEQRVDTVLTYMRGLVAAGYLQRVDDYRPEHRPLRELGGYVLRLDAGVEAPRVTGDGKPVTQGVGRDQLWRAMRVLREFDCRELTGAASTEQHAVSFSEAQTYVKYLARAGYLQLVTAACETRGAGARYRFVRSYNTGPRPPLITRTKCVMDQNNGAVVWSPKGDAK